MPENSGGRVGVELEAAEALAALASHMISDAFAEDHDSQSISKRFKNTSESSSTNPHDGLEVQKKNTKTITSMVMHTERTEQEFNRMRYTIRGSGSCIKSRNHLTEVEKEQRRIRRVLANRESARQTIRRRQVMYELLTNNAAELTTENENLKTENEKALTKYSSLKSMNERLKDLLEKVVKAEAIRVQCGAPDLSPINPSTSYIAPTLSLPFFWPPFVNPSEASPVVASLVSQANSEQGLGAPVYVIPFPWFFPLQMQCILQSLQPSIQYIQHGDIQGSSSQGDGDMENCVASSYLDGGYGVAPYTTCSKSAETAPGDDKLVQIAVASSSKWSVETKKETPNSYSGKTSASAAVAAEARRRRKELTKLKTLYCLNHRVR